MRLHVDVTQAETESELRFGYRCVERIGSEPWLIGATTNSRGVLITEPVVSDEQRLNDEVTYRDYAFVAHVDWRNIDNAEVNGQIILMGNAESQRSLPVVHFSAVQRPSIVAVPNTVYFQQRGSDEAITRRVVLRGLDQSTWRLLKIHSDSEWLTVTETKQSAERLRIIELIATPGSISERPVRTRVVVTTDHPQCREISIPVEIY